MKLQRWGRKMECIPQWEFGGVYDPGQQASYEGAVEGLTITCPIKPLGRSALATSSTRARKNFSLRQVPGTNGFGDGGQGFFPVGFPCPCPPPPLVCRQPPPPRAPLFWVRCRKQRRNAQRRVTYAPPGAQKKGGIRGVPTVQCCLHPGED